MPRTSVYLSDHTLKTATAVASDLGIPLSKVVEMALQVFFLPSGHNQEIKDWRKVLADSGFESRARKVEAVVKGLKATPWDPNE